MRDEPKERRRRRLYIGFQSVGDILIGYILHVFCFLGDLVNTMCVTSGSQAQIMLWFHVYCNDSI